MVGFTGFRTATTEELGTMATVPGALTRTHCGENLMREVEQPGSEGLCCLFRKHR